MRSRNLSLDVLRGLAILLVLGRHLPEGTAPLTGPLMEFCRFWYRIGWSGVDLFFVLSGFLVSRILFREFQAQGTVNLGRFLIRRGLRIWPAYYVMTALTLPWVSGPIPVRQLLSELFFLQSYVVHVWKHTWTLAVEEHFYLFFGALVWGLSRLRLKNRFDAIRWVWMLAALGCLWGRLQIPYGDMWPFARTHLRADALLFGTLLSYYVCFHRTITEPWVRRLRGALVILAAILLSPIAFLHLGAEPFIPRFGLTLAYMGYGLLVLVGACSNEASGSGFKKIVAWVGVRSYSMYLWHYPIRSLIAQPLADHFGGAGGLWLSVSVYLGASIAAGLLSYRFIEQPLLAFRDQRFPSAQTA